MHRVALMPGDGIGPEIIEAAVRVIEATGVNIEWFRLEGGSETGRKTGVSLPEETLEEFDRLVEEYRADLYTRAYKEALVAQDQDTTISRSELETYYEEQKENFRLKEKLVRLRFVEIPLQFLNKDEIIKNEFHFQRLIFGSN